MVTSVRNFTACSTRPTSARSLAAVSTSGKSRIRCWRSPTSVATESASIDVFAVFASRCAVVPARLEPGATRNTASLRFCLGDARARHLDLAAQAASFGDGEARRHDVAGYGAGGANVDLLLGRDVAGDGAHDDDRLAGDLGLDVRVGADRQRVSGHADASLHPSGKREIF